MENFEIPCDAFERNDDGSWSVTRPMTVTGSDGSPIQIGPGVTFRPGVSFKGFDLATMLEEQCT